MTARNPLRCGQAMIELDMKGAFDDRGTPDDFTDDKPRGAAAVLRAASSTAAPRSRPAP